MNPQYFFSLGRFFKNPMGQRKIQTRAQKKARNNLGVILEEMGDSELLYRDPRLAILDMYYENSQYDHLQPWENSCDSQGEHIPIRERRPRIIIPFARGITGRLISKMFGDEVFPNLNIEESPDDQEFIRAVVRESNLKYEILEPARRLLNTGSIFIRFWISHGVFKTEYFDTKYCYPIFAPNGELESVVIKYVYVDPEEKDHKGDYKKKWFKMELTSQAEIRYDNPDYDANNRSEPEFTVVERVEHGFGFVQGEWFRTSKNRHCPDGYSMVEEVTDLIDELCYSLSQSSQAISFNQDPQLWFKGMDEEEISDLIRSALKSWNLGRNGEAGLLESNLTGADKANEMRDKVRQYVQDFARVTLLDPEKMVGAAQSAKAMEVLHGPMIDLILELRGMIEPSFKHLIVKMAMAVLIANRQGLEVPIVMPPGYQPQTLDFEVKWRRIFQQTMEDLQKKVSVASQAKTSGIISPRTAVKFLAEDFGIEDVDAELAEIDAAMKAQAALNPYGGF